MARGLDSNLGITRRGISIAIIVANSSSSASFLITLGHSFAETSFGFSPFFLFPLPLCTLGFFRPGTTLARTMARVTNESAKNSAPSATYDRDPSGRYFSMAGQRGLGQQSLFPL